MKRIAVLGCTGSIGRQALDVIRAHRDLFCVEALSAGGRNLDLLRTQIAEFQPHFVAIDDDIKAMELRSELDAVVRLESGPDAACCAALLPEVDIVVNGISGFAGMRPLIAALEAHKTVALANKESIVCGHHIVRKALGYGGCVLPVDSEQSAIFQCLSAGAYHEIDRLVLTASGGPFRTFDAAALAAVTPEQALRHPTWSMGTNITLDSATLFNKGLEIMEASYLFEMPAERIDVLVHPQSIVHSMVTYRDGSTMAQLSVPDMRCAIQYAMTYPARIPSPVAPLDLTALSGLTFEKPDEKRFPAISLAYEALRDGNTLPIAYNGAKEVASRYFLEKKIGFLDIARLVEYAMGHIYRGPAQTVEQIMDADFEARRLVREQVERSK